MTRSLFKTCPPPKRILIIRLSAIGDIIMASGLIPALRHLWPNATIAWLAEDAMADTLAQNPKLDRVHRIPRAAWRKMRKENDYLGLIKSLLAMKRQLTNERYDLVLDLQGLLKSGIWAWASGAPYRIGLGSREGSQFLMTRVIPRE
ncbi:MAG: lipopolysaccharide heptosyltransferase, partial [Gammaproteobacteria bacterium]|nr:lipopolysaccharide heptosyltransferase [Gammaproteobacteria bacterium]